MKIRVVSDGRTINGTKVYDAETGEEMSDVVRIEFLASVDVDNVSCLVTLRSEIEMELEVQEVDQ